jgi:hypothetical protein
VNGVLRTYPRWWRERYGDEMEALLADEGVHRGDRTDLLRGSLDAWLHPPTPSWIPAIAALVGGGLWTAVAAGVLGQPVPPDWPGYLHDVLAPAMVSVAFLLVALVGIAIRGLDGAGHTMGLLIGAAGVAYVAWLLALAGSLAALADGQALAAAQTLAMVATAAIGVALIHLGDEWIGAGVLVAGVALLVPWAGMWLVFGTVWTAIGIGLVLERPRRTGSERRFA